MTNEDTEGLSGEVTCTGLTLKKCSRDSNTGPADWHIASRVARLKLSWSGAGMRPGCVWAPMSQLQKEKLIGFHSDAASLEVREKLGGAVCLAPPRS